MRYILMSEVLEKFELTVSTLGEDGSAEGLHNLLDGDILVGELISGRARFVLVRLLVPRCRYLHVRHSAANVPNETKSSHANRLEVGVSKITVRMAKTTEKWRKARVWRCVPRRYLKRRSKDLRANEFRHCEGQPRVIRGLNMSGERGAKRSRARGNVLETAIGPK